MRCKIKLFILFFMLASKVLAYDGPETTGFFPIGWAGGGDIFAYGYYMSPDMSPEEFAARDASQMVIIIQNMITDSIIYRYTKEWYETSVGDGSDIHLPSPKEAWKQIREHVNNFLSLFDIREGSFPLNSFSQNDAFNAEARSLDNNNDSGLYIKLNNGKKKMIATYNKSRSSYKDTMIQGFVWSPDKKRIAVIVMFWIERFEEFQAVGCHMKFGFK